MSKVYLLLRSNKQSGPHTLEELVKLGLKPRDLIWIEGKSFGWSYPTEINALKPYVAAVVETPVQQAPEIKSENKAASQINHQAFMPAEKKPSSVTESEPTPKVYVSMPANLNKPIEIKKQEVESVAANQVDKIEQKAEELRKRIQSYVPEINASAKNEEPILTKYTSTIPEREEEYTSWIYNQKVNKEKKITEVQKKWAAIAVLALLILAVGFGISQYHDDKKEVVLTATASTEISDANKRLPEPLITEPEIPSTQPITENNIANNIPVDASLEPARKIVNNTAAAEKPKKEIHKISPTVEIHKKELVNKTPDKEIIVKASLPETKTKPLEVKPVLKKETEQIADQPKKKKTLNEKVDAFFGKFSHKKEEAPVVVTSSPPASTNTFPGTSERKAVHRDEKMVPASPPANINIAEYVEVTTNKPSENWMLGVHGLKVSLHNSGNEIVKTAEVELRYYTEQNEVLEKKIVNFNNILPGKTVTLPAPDHRLADHADFRLVNAK
jgi:hypothetical protein